MDVHPVTLANGVRLLRQIEGTHHVGSGEQAKSACVVRLHRHNVRVLLEAALLLLEAGKELLPATRTQGGKIGVQRQLADVVVGQRAVRVDPHWVIERPQPASPLAVALFDESRSAVRHDRHHRDERRQCTLAAPQHRLNGPVAGPIVRQRAARAGPAGEQEMRRRRVIDIVMGHGADQCQPMTALGEARQMLADPQTRHGGRDRPKLAAELGRGLGLHVPGILLCGAAPHEEHNTRLGSPRRSVRAGAPFQQPRQAQAEQAQRSGLKELATAHERVEAETAASGLHSLSCA